VFMRILRKVGRLRGSDGKLEGNGGVSFPCSEEIPHIPPDLGKGT
jgi:hypothetical protein